MQKISILAVMAALATTVIAQENYTTNWSGHKNVVVNTTGAGAAVFTNVTRFPVLVRLGTADSNIFKQAKGDGADIRFTKANNTTRIHHQIERWDSAGRTAAVWVRVDTVYGNRNNQLFRLHWGNAAAADSSRGTAVFDTAAGFRAVWHMNDTGNVADATARGLTAVANGSPASVNGMIGRARSFNGSSSYFSVPGSETALNFAVNSNYSVSAWINATQLASHGTVLSKSDFAYALKLQSGATWEFFEYNDGWNAATAFTPAETGVWIHLLGVQNGPSTLLYVNGVLENPDAVLTTGGSGRNETIGVNIGREPQATGGRRYFNGLIDEVRVHGVSRSVEWARLEYQNQRAAQTMVRLLDTIPALDTTAVPGAPTAVTATASTTVSGQALLSWTAPASTGGSAITGYRAFAVSDTARFCVTAGTTTCTINGLMPESTYTFRVRASNVVGIGAASAASASLLMPVSVSGAKSGAASFGFTAKPQGEGVLFRIQGTEELHRTRLALVDMFGRTVWAGTFAAAGTQDVFWNGRANNGVRAPAGIYLVRATLLDGSGNAVQTLDRKLPLTR